MAFQGRGGFDQGPRQMFDAVCSKCGNPTKVPFQPRQGRPVYCRDCYMEQKNNNMMQ